MKLIFSNYRLQVFGSQQSSVDGQQNTRGHKLSIQNCGSRLLIVNYKL